MKATGFSRGLRVCFPSLRAAYFQDSNLAGLIGRFLHAPGRSLSTLGLRWSLEKVRSETSEEFRNQFGCDSFQRSANIFAKV